MLSVSEAEKAILTAMLPFGSVAVPVENSSGKVLNQVVCADRPLPPFDRSMMDGIALAAASGSCGQLPIVGTLLAGDPASSPIAPMQCVRIMTGAMLPQGCDSVVPIEEVRIDGDTAILEAAEQIVPGRFVHPCGSDCVAGQTLLSPGIRLGSPHVAVLAGVGLAEVAVTLLPRVTVVSTGNELVPPGEPILVQEIRPSSSYALQATLLQMGFSDVGRVHLPDDPLAMETALAEVLATSAVVILSGGVSKGTHDFVPAVLEQLGVAPVFHRLALKPGKPMWFGMGNGQQAVFALPGNPVSTLTCFRRFVVPALERAMGLEPCPIAHAVLEDDIEFSAPLARMIPVRIREGTNGLRYARPLPGNTSGDFASLARSDGFVEMEAAASVVHSGSALPYYPWKPS